MEGPVRRCRACGRPAMVAVRAWDQSHSVYGIPTGTTPGGGGTDLVCQGCGVAYTLRPPSLVGFLMLPLAAMFVGLGAVLVVLGVGALQPWLIGTALLPLGFGAVMLRESAWPMWVRWRNPVVPEAPFPEVRFLGLEPRRRCSCGATARCTQVTANRINGIYTGTDYAFACDSCEHTFTIESPMGLLTTSGAGVLLLGIAFVAVPSAGDRWSGWACAGILGILGALLLQTAASRLLALRRHPAVIVPG